MTLLLLAAIHSAALLAPPGEPSLIVTELEGILRGSPVPGAGIVIVPRDGPVLVTGLGLARKDPPVPASRDTLFFLASISKSFTAAALMVLVEEGRVRLEAPLSAAASDVEFVNPWEAAHPVRVVDLLEHTSGFSELSPREWLFDRADCPLGDGLAVNRRTLSSRWPPGTHYSYSSINYLVAGRVIEHASGMDFDSFLEERLFKPLGITHAGFGTPREDPEHLLAATYDTAGALHPPRHLHTRPGSMLTLSPAGMASFLLMLLGAGRFQDRQVLAEETVERMERPSGFAAREGLAHGYGLGLAHDDIGGRSFWGHDGYWNHSISVYRYSRELGTGYAVMLNADDWSTMRRLRKAIESHLLNGLPPRPLPEPHPLSEDRRAAWSGVFEPLTSREWTAYPLERFLSRVSLSWQEGVLSVTPLTGGKEERWIPLTVRLLRRPQSPLAAALIAEDGAGRPLLVSGRSFGRVRGSRLLLEAVLIPFSLLMTLTAPPLAVLWLVLGRRKERRRAFPRWLVLSVPGPSLSLAYAAFATFFRLQEPSRLASMNPDSLGLFASTLLFIGLALGGGLLSLATLRRGVNPWLRAHALGVALANLLILGYGATFGLLPLRTWAL